MPSSVDKPASLAERLEPQAGYNFAHFRTGHLLADAVRTIRGVGVRPGAMAPDLEFPATDGRSVRLRAPHGSPVLLHFGSLT